MVNSKKIDLAQRIHPVWQGIGCIMLIVIPVMAYAGASIVVNNVAVVRQMIINAPYLSDTVDVLGWITVIGNFVPQIAEPLDAFKTSLGIAPVPFFWGKISVTVLLSVLGFGLYGIVYSIIYKISAPKRYGPLDAPPERYKKKRKVKQVKY